MLALRRITASVARLFHCQRPAKLGGQLRRHFASFRFLEQIHFSIISLPCETLHANRNRNLAPLAAGKVHFFAQQAMVSELSTARLGSDLVDSGNELGPESASSERSQARTAGDDSIEQIDVTQHIGNVRHERPDEPPRELARHQPENDRPEQPTGER